MSHHASKKHWDPRYGHRSDIDLDTGSFSRDRSIPRWTCGNSKRRKALVERFAKTSSVHGTAYLCSSRKTSLHLKIIYRVFFSICFLSTIYSVITVFLDNYAKESTFVNIINKDIVSGEEEDPDYFPNYPQITICRSPSYRTDYNTSYLKLVEYAMLALGEPFAPLTPEEVGMLAIIENVEFQDFLEEKYTNQSIQFEKRLRSLEDRFAILKNSDVNFDLKQFIVDHSLRCEEIFVSCAFLLLPLDCCGLFEPILTNYGLCFTFMDTKHIDTFTKGYTDEFSFVIDLHTPPRLEQHAEVGFRVFLSDPDEEHPFLLDEFEEQSVFPGLVTTIKTQLVKMQRTALHTPWTGLSPDCPIWSPSANESTDRYSKRQCRVHFFLEMMRTHCKCETVLYTGKSTLPLCGPEVIYKCYNIFSLKNNMTECETPCIVYKYKSDASYVGLGGSNRSRVEFVHNSQQYIYNEYRKTTLSSLFSQIGGCLGLYLGASIITVLEIITFVASWIYYRFIPSKTTSKVRQAHSNFNK